MNRTVLTPCEQILMRCQWYKWNQLPSYRHWAELLLTFSQLHQENALLGSLLTTMEQGKEFWVMRQFYSGGQERKKKSYFGEALVWL